MKHEQFLLISLQWMVHWHHILWPSYILQSNWHNTQPWLTSHLIYHLTNTLRQNAHCANWLNSLLETSQKSCTLLPVTQFRHLREVYLAKIWWLIGVGGPPTQNFSEIFLAGLYRCFLYKRDNESLHQSSSSWKGLHIEHSWSFDGFKLYCCAFTALREKTDSSYFNGRMLFLCRMEDPF